MMARRRDASAALYELAQRINQEFPKLAAERSVWTMGRLKSSRTRRRSCRATPNSTCNSAMPPRRSSMRSPRPPSASSPMNARGSVRIAATPARAPIAPTQMDDGLRSHLEAAAEKHARASGCACPAAHSTTQASSPRACRRRCCSFRRSAASAMISPRTAAKRTSYSAARCSRTPWPRAPQRPASAASKRLFQYEGITPSCSPIFAVAKFHFATGFKFFARNSANPADLLAGATGSLLRSAQFPSPADPAQANARLRIAVHDRTVRGPRRCGRCRSP